MSYLVDIFIIFKIIYCVTSDLMNLFRGLFNDAFGVKAYGVWASWNSEYLQQHMSYGFMLAFQLIAFVFW
jgi:hypothetical protein